MDLLFLSKIPKIPIPNWSYFMDEIKEWPDEQLEIRIKIGV